MSKYQEALDRQKKNVKQLRDIKFIEYGEDFRFLQSLITSHATMKQEIGALVEEYSEYIDYIREGTMEDKIKSYKQFIKDLQSILKGNE